MSLNTGHIGIAGGGLLGRLAAWRLLRQGFSVSVFDAGGFDQPQGACWTAAGMISPLSELVHSPRAVYDMGMETLDIWPVWQQQLQQDLQLDDTQLCFRQAGSLLVAHPQDDNELQQFYRDLVHKLGTETDAQLTWFDQATITQHEPALGHFPQALFMKPEGDVDNRRLLHQLHQLLQQHDNATLIGHSRVECRANQIVESDGSVHGFDLVLDTRGLGAKTDLEQVQGGMRGVRGEVLYVHCPDVSLQRPVRLMHPRYKLYVAPKPGHNFVIGATEIESSDMSPMSLQSCLELSSALYTINPAFSEARIIEQSVHCRPAMMDNLPVIEQQPGLIRANGLYRHGYLLSPAVVTEVLARIQGA